MPAIDPEVMKQYEDYLDLFVHPGWKLFINELASSLKQDQRTAAQRCSTADLWFTERGAQGKTTKILNFETIIRTQYEAIKEQEKEDEDLTE